ncbi:metallophosphoesterase [Neokomagataea tanensis]|uniref:Metallophosphoesterase n=2 Tax=Acetobacteraceae TaxID=433 RepID=A0A4Y6V6S5_9PROT|nr:metallophosphoesterase [Neokomagataea tanensis]
MPQSDTQQSPATDIPASQHTQNQSCVRIAHLSDPHLPPPPVPWSQAFNKRGLSLLSWHKHRRHVHQAPLCDALVQDIARTEVDAIMVSGDLTNFGTPAEFTKAAQWLAALPAPAFVIPGNHDAMVRQPEATGRSKWIDWAAPQYPYCHELNGVAIIGVNSGVPTLPFMASGRVGKQQRQRLATLLKRTHDAGLCRVVMIHHPPCKGLVPWRKALHDMKAVTDVLRAEGAEIVLHGHSHNATLTHIPNSTIPLLGVASASLQSAKPHRQACWNELTITPHAQTAHKHWTITLQRHWPSFSGPHSGVVESASWERGYK